MKNKKINVEAIVSYATNYEVMVCSEVHAIKSWSKKLFLRGLPISKEYSEPLWVIAVNGNDVQFFDSLVKAIEFYDNINENNYKEYLS